VLVALAGIGYHLKAQVITFSDFQIFCFFLQTFVFAFTFCIKRLILWVIIFTDLPKNHQILLYFSVIVARFPPINILHCSIAY
jgi:hypothetical protein